MHYRSRHDSAVRLYCKINFDKNNNPTIILGNLRSAWLSRKTWQPLNWIDKEWPHKYCAEKLKSHQNARISQKQSSLWNPQLRIRLPDFPEWNPQLRIWLPDFPGWNQQVRIGWKEVSGMSSTSEDRLEGNAFALATSVDLVNGVSGMWSALWDETHRNDWCVIRRCGEEHECLVIMYFFLNTNYHDYSNMTEGNNYHELFMNYIIDITDFTDHKCP